MKYSAAKEDKYTKKNNNLYTAEFIDVCTKHDEKFNSSFDTKLAELEESNIPESEFSEGWINDFMKSNSLSVRWAQIKRRGEINKEESQAFLQMVREAAAKFGWDRIFNMDETSIRIINSTDTTIVPVGTEEIIIEGEKNTKECFTAIGTCNKYKLFNLVVLVIGITPFNPILKNCFSCFH